MKEKKKIFMLTQTVFPPDIRLEKEIKSLSEFGYQVKVFCNQFEKKKGISFEFCEIDRLKARFESVFINKIINFPFVINPRFLFRAILSVAKYRPDFIHAHNLPMVPIGFFVKFIFRIPLIYDMHENYPAALKAYQKKGLTNKLFKNQTVAFYIERIFLKLSDALIVVIKENKERLVTKERIPENKIFVVSNTVDIKTFGIKEPLEEIVKKYSEKIILLYTGVVSKNRGLDTPIRALKYIKKKFPNIIFLIVGNGDGGEYLKEIVLEEKLGKYVEFINWPGHENLNSYIKMAHVCTIPQPAIESNNTTIPHKLFEYMSKGKKLLVSDAKPLKRIIDETRAGMYFLSFNKKDYSQKIFDLLESSEDFSNNGIRAVREKYNWNEDSKKLIEMYKKLK